MAKHMAGKNQRPYSAEDRARRAAKADPAQHGLPS